MGREKLHFLFQKKYLFEKELQANFHSASCLCYIQFSSNFDLFFFSFQDFDVQGSRRCSSDWLTIGSYKNSEGYRACGSSIPSPYISSQDHVWIRFHSDDSISRKGFRLAYFAGMFQMIPCIILWFRFLFPLSRITSS